MTEVLSVLLYLGWIPGLFGLLFGWFQLRLVRRGSDHQRALPCCTGAMALLCAACFLGISGWDQLMWAFYLIFAAAAFLGTLLGWAKGRRERKLREEEEAENP